MTKKHYKAIAQVIKNNSQTMVDEKSFSTQEGDTLTDWVNKDRLINDLCDMFKQDNNLFNRDKFKEACKVEKYTKEEFEEACNR